MDILQKKFIHLKKMWLDESFRLAELPKATAIFVMSVYPPILMEQVGSHWIEGHDILY
jgi:hypothetical protein